MDGGWQGWSLAWQQHRKTIGVLRHRRCTLEHRTSPQTVAQFIVIHHTRVWFGGIILCLLCTIFRVKYFVNLDPTPQKCKFETPFVYFLQFTYAYYYTLKNVCFFRASYASVLTIVSFSLERYIAICRPLYVYSLGDFQRAIRVIRYILESVYIIINQVDHLLF